MVWETTTGSAPDSPVYHFTGTHKSVAFSFYFFFLIEIKWIQTFKKRQWIPDNCSCSWAHWRQRETIWANASEQLYWKTGSASVMRPVPVAPGRLDQLTWKQSDTAKWLPKKRDLQRHRWAESVEITMCRQGSKGNHESGKGTRQPWLHPVDQMLISGSKRIRDDSKVPG